MEARYMTARYSGSCLAGRECMTGGKVYPGQLIVWEGHGCVFHQNCQDIVDGNRFGEYEAEQERQVYVMKMNRELQSVHFGPEGGKSVAVK